MFLWMLQKTVKEELEVLSNNIMQWIIGEYKFKREREQGEGQGDWWGLACPSETEDKEEEPWTLSQ